MASNKPKINRSASVYKPERYDQCQTPPWAVEAVIKFINPCRKIWEPASGEGYISSYLRANNFEVLATELDKNVETITPTTLGVNFFEVEEPLGDVILTNPPYSGNLKQEFLKRCIKHYKKHGTSFALLMPVEFIGTSSAQKLFEDVPLQVIYMNTRVDFKMPDIGWTGKNTNKMIKNKKGEWVHQSGAQFPTCWYTVGLNLLRDIVFYDVTPYKMEVLSDPYHWDSEENKIKLELF